MDDDFQPDKLPEPDIDIILDDEVDNPLKPKSSLAPHKHIKKLKNKEPLTKKEKWIIAVELVLIAIGLAAIVFYILKPTTVVAPKAVIPTTKQNATSTLVRSPLSGLFVTPTQAALPVTAVMVENSDEARPQSGLSQAGIIFEAIAEGGITRFLALYQEGQPSSIGPIRSARPYYVDWLLPFHASYAHVGGSPDGLTAIQTYNVQDMDQFYNGSAYYRISSREAPHNVYTSMADLNNLEKSKGYKPQSFVSFPRKNDKPLATPTATQINLNIAGPDFAVHYDYNKLGNNYLRSEAGSPMIDANTSKQLSPRVVIAIVVPISQGALDSSGAYYSEYADVGSGKAYIFQDGGVTIGTWSKASPSSQILFGDANGDPIGLNAGQTWITAVGDSSLVSYSAQ